MKTNSYKNEFKIYSTGNPAHQQGGNLCEMVAGGRQVRGRIIEQDDLRLLFRIREQLVGVQAYQEAHQVGGLFILLYIFQQFYVMLS